MEKEFKVKFSGNSMQVKPGFSRNSTTIDSKIEPNSKQSSEEIVYDEIVYYDGGGVEGYGDS